MKPIFIILIIIALAAGIGITWKLGVFQEVFPSGCDAPFITSDAQVTREGSKVIIKVDPNDNTGTCINLQLSAERMKEATGVNLKPVNTFIRLDSHTQVHLLTEKGEAMNNIGRKDIGSMNMLLCTISRCNNEVQNTFDTESTDGKCYCYYEEQVADQIHNTVNPQSMLNYDYIFKVYWNYPDQDMTFTSKDDQRKSFTGGPAGGLVVEYKGNHLEDFNWYDLGNNYKIIQVEDEYRILTNTQFNDATELLNDGISEIKTASDNDKEDIYREKVALINNRLEPATLAGVRITFAGDNVILVNEKGNAKPGFSPKLEFTVPLSVLTPELECTESADCAEEETCIFESCIPKTALYTVGIIAALIIIIAIAISIRRRQQMPPRR